MEISLGKSKYYKYEFNFLYNQDVSDYCEFLKDSLGWKVFNFSDGAWRFSDPEIVGWIMEKFPNTQVSNEVNRDLNLFKESNEKTIKASAFIKDLKDNKAKPSIDVTGLKYPLYDYQKLGVEFFINNSGRAILADEMGTGKTIQTISFLVHSGFKRSLVVCPASVKYVWEAEIKKWTKITSYVVTPKSKLSDIPHDTDVVIINYDVLKKFLNELLKYKWDCIVGDESHLLKSRTAIRSKAFKQISREVPHVILLTGTPILSRPIELFNLLSILDPRVWNNWYQYAIRYAEGKQTRWGFEAKGSSNLEELKMRIDKYFLRRTKAEVLKELPPKNFIEIPMDLNSDYRKQYNLISKDLLKYLKEHKKEKSSSILKSMQAEKLVRLNMLRDVISMGKIDTAKELIQNIIDGNEKVIVFSCFKKPLEILNEMFKEESVLLDGDTPVAERQKLVKSFQENEKIKVFFGGIKSAGVGITLTEATNVIFLDLSWNPADHGQAQDRMHRPGQKASSVNIYQIIAKDTIDSKIKNLLHSKQKIFDLLIEGDEDEQTNLTLDDIIESLK